MLNGSFEKALVEIEQAILLQPEMHDAYFWKGMVCATLVQDEKAIPAIERALKLKLPPVPLTPLHWLEQDKPDFFRKYVGPLLAGF